MMTCTYSIGPDQWLSVERPWRHKMWRVALYRRKTSPGPLSEYRWLMESGDGGWVWGPWNLSIEPAHFRLRAEAKAAALATLMEGPVP